MAFGGPPFLAGSDPLPRLLLIGGDGHPSGVPRHIRHLCTALQDQAQITVISDENHGGYDGLDGATHIIVPGLQSRLSARHLMRGWCGLGRVLRAQGAQVIWLHARLPVLFGRMMLALRLWRPKAARVVVTYHGLPFGPGHKLMAGGVSKMLEKGLLSACPPLDLVFLSQDQARRMTAAMGARMGRHRVHVLPNSSDLGPLPEVAHGPGRHLVMTGRCGWQKNYPLALRLFAHLPDDYTLTLCGAGTEAAGFQAEAAEILPPEALARVRFAGPLSDVRPALAGADGYLLCSRYEGLPIGAIEAFEAGLPLILGTFDGADELAATHPMALCLEFEDLARDAGQITALLEGYTARRDAATQEIRTAWAKAWSFDRFRANARAVYDTLAGTD
ncbi:hypothetical protein AB838_01145 [Rhodobacteraceae bacterium (ex Bugula neritina AB1)]|nr:hypothetical protein AB838_01145 [Rhodobacteraceae bacterium (ex Bugula neritina AB1)]